MVSTLVGSVLTHTSHESKPGIEVNMGGRNRTTGYITDEELLWVTDELSCIRPRMSH
jgi:hypothetical protein